jgi:hypothetical protein
MTSESRTEQLFSLMEAKLGLLSELRNVAMHQSEAVDKQDLGELLQLLGRKQSLMDRLLAIQDLLRPFQQEDPETRQWSSPERRASCQTTKRKCDQWLQEILVMEQRAMEVMSSHRDAVSGQLVQATDAMRLSRAYGFESDPDIQLESAISLDG